MSKMNKALLVLALVGLVAGLALNTGLIGAGGSEVIYIVLPLGATFLGLFLIEKVLSKETARYDEEQSAAHLAAEHTEGNKTSDQRSPSGSATRTRNESAAQIH